MHTPSFRPKATRDLIAASRRLIVLGASPASASMALYLVTTCSELQT
ncbi:hypothetical protein COO91_09160 (plasmid) [Nostoc flagelliforme CCNUN1]|uniref:Uncharacterized protein n=1 Tax=Nostoc flagelliforme CCNUN1 TaxID=2038116 RepID=A0A2K8T5M7_9NOSO|nr:hypothetical protein COO91_09160 [Nostoc flagelliforme CCNUN1]